MSRLSTPTVEGPLYACAETVLLRGTLRGATVEIFAQFPGSEPEVTIGGGTVTLLGGQIFAVDPSRMVEGVVITARQTFEEQESPRSAGVTVQKPLSVDAPVLRAPLYECAECLRVGGLLPGATVQVLDAGTLLGERPAPISAIQVGISPPLGTGRVITAHQVSCGSPGPESTGITVEPVFQRELVPAAPEIEGPLFACQEIVTIHGCLPGARVELFLDGARKSTGCASGATTTRRIENGLSPGTAVTVRQSLCDGTFVSPFSEPVIAGPADDLPRPVVHEPLYAGSTRVRIGLLVPGSTVRVEVSGEGVGWASAGAATEWINVDPPLQAGQKVRARVELCGVEKESLPVLVGQGPRTLAPPKIAEPLLACGLNVRVLSCYPGADITVYAEDGGNTVEVGSGVASGDGVLVPVTPVLKAGWRVHAVQKVDPVSSGPSAVTEVEPPPGVPTPVLVTPILECSRGVRVEQTVPGARIDVYQNDVWAGGADATGEETEVSVHPGLILGARITATQTVCGAVSDRAEANVIREITEVPPPRLFPAFAKDRSVVAGNLVPGARVEVEEVSVYGQVVGRAVVTRDRQSISLDLPLFAGGVLRARQILCGPSPWSEEVLITQPREWPLGPGPYKAGFRLVSDIPISPGVAFPGAQEECNDGVYNFRRPDAHRAVVFYPAAAEGESEPFALDGPFPVVVLGHARRKPACFTNHEVRPGSPEDTVGDYLQYRGILSHLARWGFVCASVDLSWLAPNPSIGEWSLTLEDTAQYLFKENGRPSSPFSGKLRTDGVCLMGHSTSGVAAIESATVLGNLTVHALALLAPAGTSEISQFAPRPVLVLRGTAEGGIGTDGGGSFAVYSAAHPSKYMVLIEGGTHFGFTDSIRLQAETPGIDERDQQRIAAAYIAAFFRRHLLGDTRMDAYLTDSRRIEELEDFTLTVSSETV